MRFSLRYFATLAILTMGLLCSLLCIAMPVAAQSTFTAQLTGVVSDSSGAVVPGAKVTLTDEATNVTSTYTTDNRGIYVFTGVRPAAYTIRVEAPSLAAQESKGVVLAVSQQATLDFTLTPGKISESITVTAQAPLLDTGNASLGTDVTNEYVRDIPLINRSMFGLVFLAGGVTEAAGNGTQDSYPSGTNFVSNGQRNATAEVRLDGALTSAPEQGEGATTGVFYQPSVEIVQEFKVENNSFSAEYGNNGGTVVNMVLKQGGNQFHGSAWWFGQRAAMDANDFFLNQIPNSKPDHARDQYGFAVGGPIRKEKTFFFVDFEKLRQDDPVNLSGTVPTDEQRLGNFSQTFNDDGTLQQIYNPRVCVPQPSGPCQRALIPGNDLTVLTPDPIGLAVLQMYPEPIPGLGDPVTGLNNWRAATLYKQSQYQFDIKIDHHFNDRQMLSGRYSFLHNDSTTPYIVGSGDFNDGWTSFTKVNNVGLEYTWTLKPTLLWTSRFALDRVNSPVKPLLPPLTAAGFPDILQQANGLTRMPSIQVDNGDGTNNWVNLDTQCCVDTNFAHTLYSYSSALSWVKGRHTLKFGFEQRQFFNNFFQPDNPTGFFNFTQSTTNEFAGDNQSNQGNPFASLYLGYGDSGSFINIKPSVADKSWETAFYVQDDWRISPRLTVNLGLRYEWSDPYTVRHDRIQFSDFSGDTGISIVLPLSNGQPVELKGTTLFPGDPGVGRSVPVDRNNIAPRLGFAFSLDSKTVLRGGTGIYYGLNPATNFQYAGWAYNSSVPVIFSLDEGVHQNATLDVPFPAGLPNPQQRAYGKLALWGYDNSNDLGTQEARNAEIYQWNLGIQHLFPGEITIGIDYSASRSTHLPYSTNSSTRNRNFISSSLLAQIVADPTIVGCDPDPGPNNINVSNCLGSLVDNPFLPYFQGPNAIFNEPAAPQYNNAQIPLINLLRPHPQFDGSFQGLPNFGAFASYNSMQVRFQKRPSHYVSFEGNYTYSKAIDNSSAGANSFVGALGFGVPQQLDRLQFERSVSANDTTHRFVLAAIVDVPIGRDRWIGHDMNRVLDAIVGGWSIATIVTFQSGQPLALIVSDGQLADGVQRPDLACPGLSSGLSYHAAAASGNSVFNADCFSAPPQQVPGNAPRYFSNLRSDGIHNADLSFSKEFDIRENMQLQIRGEFFNLTNTPRFGYPDLGVGSDTFGTVTLTAAGSTPRRTQIGVRFQF
jgi:Carboxypeptidase regulatory-like domain/TonB dependent receptor